MTEPRIIGSGGPAAHPAAAPQSDPRDTVPQWVDPSQATAASPEPIGRPPASVSPEEWVASEGTLIRMLCRHYGWMTVQPGQMIRHNLSRS
jgi:hypothetical protein